jgi:hypothetical protein
MEPVAVVDERVVGQLGADHRASNITVTGSNQRIRAPVHRHCRTPG